MTSSLSNQLRKAKSREYDLALGRSHHFVCVLVARRRGGPSVMYNNCGGERMALYADNAGSTIYGDLSKQGLLNFNYAVMGLKERSFDQIPHTGLSADYVSRETKRLWKVLPARGP
jgi:hypothetical protein